MQNIDFRMVRQLWMFLAVAEERHFGRAARRLGMSQPPLTEQIKLLEHALGVRLLERSRRGTQLTPAGEAVLPAVRNFVEQGAALEQVVREAAAGQSAVLHIGAITSAMLDTVPPLLSEFRQRYPRLTVFVREIDSVEAVPALMAGELDLAFVRLDNRGLRDISVLPLAEDRLAVALPGGHHLAALAEVRMGLLSAEHFVMSSRKVSPDYFDMLVATCREHGFSPRILHEVRSVASQVAYVGCGQGVALVPASMSRLAPDNVVIRPLLENVKVVTAALAWNEKRHQPFVEEAVTWLKARHAAR